MLRIAAVLFALTPTLTSGAPSVGRISAPMFFEPNRGQADPSVAFIARSRGYLVQVQKSGARLSIATANGQSLRMELAGANGKNMKAVGPLVGRSNYLIGNDPARHHTNIPHFEKVQLQSAYPGIDVVYYGNQRLLEYDFIVKPGADPSQIRLRFDGQSNLRISPEGDLDLQFDGTHWKQPPPTLYQLPDRTPVQGAYRINSDGTVGFSIPSWDTHKTLVIDPVLSFANYLGGSGNDQAESVALDSIGNIYVSGSAASGNFPAIGAYQGTLKGPGDVFVTKFNPTGTAVVYSTFLGGTDSFISEHGYGIAVDSTGRAWVTGESWASDFPTIATPLGTTSCSAKAFLARLNAAGNGLDVSFCIPNTSKGVALAIDGTGNIFVGGEVYGVGLPVVNAAQTAPGSSTDGFVGKIDSAVTAWQYLTYLGGSSVDDLKALAVDSAGNACVTGSTWSTNLPMVNALQPTNASGGPLDAFVFKYNPTGTIVYSTYLGGTAFDEGRGVAIDSLGNCYVTGSTYSSTFPVLNPAQSSLSADSDAFVTAYNSTGSAYLFSTFAGGSAKDVGKSIAIGSNNMVHVSGDSLSSNFPVLNPLQAEIHEVGSVWRSVNGGVAFGRTSLQGVSVTALAVEPTNPQFLYAGTSDGFYRSIDGGVNWARTDSGWTYKYIKSLAVDPAVPCKLYAGIDIQTSLYNSSAAVLLSTDCGASWGLPPWTDYIRHAVSVAPNYAAPFTVYYSFERNLTTTTTQRGVARSIPNGVEFSYPGPGGYYRVAADPANPCTAYASETTGSVYKNTSCSVWNWSAIGSGLGWITAIAVHPSNQATVVVGNDIGGIYRKADAGSQFQLVATVNGNVSALVYHPTNPLILYASTVSGGVYKSTDGGANWSPLSNLGSISALATATAAPENLYASTFAGSDIFYTRLASNGTLLDSTLIGGRGTDTVAKIAVDTAGNAVIAGTTSALDFPATSGAAYTASGGKMDAFILKISASGTCAFALASPSAAPDAAGGSASVGLTTSNGCIWSAYSQADWIAISSGSSGNGTATINYSVSPNSSPGQRVGTLRIAGKTFTVTQSSGGCSYSILPTSANPSAGGSQSSVGVTATAGCAWTAVSEANWIVVSSGSSGTGNGTVNYSVSANPSTVQRVGTLKIGGQTFTVTQSGISCAYAILPTSANVPAKATSLTVGVTATAGCAWSAVSNSAWLTVTGGATGNGNGTVSYSVATNTGVARAGSIAIAGQNFAVSQPASPAQKIGAFDNGYWLLDMNGNSVWDDLVTDRRIFFSLGAGEIPVTGDWNGSGTTKVGIYRDGTWLLDFNGNGIWDGPAVDKLLYFGGPGFTPYVGDWNGSGSSKIAVHQNGTWLIDFNGNFAWDGPAVDKLLYFGGPGYTPYIGDWNGSGTAKIAVHQNGTWIIDYNGNFTWDGPVVDRLLYFGGPGYTPVIGDWNGDGKQELAAHQNGTWIVDYNGNFAWDGLVTDRLVFFGGAGYTPLAGDWNGDGKSKVAAYNAGQWVMDRNGSYAWEGPPSDVVTFFGGPGQVPVVGRW